MNGGIEEGDGIVWGGAGVGCTGMRVDDDRAGAGGGPGEGVRAWTRGTCGWVRGCAGIGPVFFACIGIGIGPALDAATLARLPSPEGPVPTLLVLGGDTRPEAIWTWVCPVSPFPTPIPTARSVHELCREMNVGLTRRRSRAADAVLKGTPASAEPEPGADTERCRFRGTLVRVVVVVAGLGAGAGDMIGADMG